MPVFAKDFARSWMSKASPTDELERIVTGRLSSTLRANGWTTQAPIGFRFLMRQLARHVDVDSAFEVTCDCALLGELIFTSGRGGIYKLTESDDPDEQKFHEPLLALRNACFHPGNLGASPNVPAVIEALRMTGDRGLADRLDKDWGLLSCSNDIARWALQRLHAVGRYELIVLGRWWPEPP